MPRPCGTPGSTRPAFGVRRSRRAAAPLVVGTLALALAAGCAATAAVAGPIAGPWRWRADTRVTHTDTAYTSDGRRVAVERFAPADGRCAPAVAAPGAPGRCPVVLVLHPSSGPRGRGGVTVRLWADALARDGRVAYVVHYFDRTGDRATDDAREDAEFPVWTAALEDAVTFAQHDPAVDPGHVEAFGYSLGGYMALALGAADPRVTRLVVLSGGFFDALAARVHRLPPTLLLHGDADGVVPLAEAGRVDRALTALGVRHSLVVYPGLGHGLDVAAMPDAIARATAFLHDDAGGAGAATAAVGDVR